MSLRSILFGSASRFGHLASPPPAPRADEGGGDDEEAKRPPAARQAAADEDDAARKAEEEDAARKARKARKAKRAKSKTRGGEDNDDDDDADDAGRDGEEDDDDDDMKKAATAGHTLALDAAFRAGARAQRQRCSAIFAHPSAAANIFLATSLAFETSMTSDMAIAVLEKTPAPRGGSSLHDRMAVSPAGNVRVPAAAPNGPSGQAAISASWDFAMKDFAPVR